MFMTMTKEQQSADEASTSHGLLLKGGFIRQVKQGRGEYLVVWIFKLLSYSQLQGSIQCFHWVFVCSARLKTSSIKNLVLLVSNLMFICAYDKSIDRYSYHPGSQKLALPLLLSAENWKKTGRWNASKGEVMV